MQTMVMMSGRLKRSSLTSGGPSFPSFMSLTPAWPRHRTSVAENRVRTSYLHSSQTGALLCGSAAPILPPALSTLRASPACLYYQRPPYQRTLGLGQYRAKLLTSVRSSHLSFSSSYTALGESFAVGETETNDASRVQTRVKWQG